MATNNLTTVSSAVSSQNLESFSMAELAQAGPALFRTASSSSEDLEWQFTEMDARQVLAAQAADFLGDDAEVICTMALNHPLSERARCNIASLYGFKRDYSWSRLCYAMRVQCDARYALLKQLNISAPAVLVSDLLSKESESLRRSIAKQYFQSESASWFEIKCEMKREKSAQIELAKLLNNDAILSAQPGSQFTRQMQRQFGTYFALGTVPNWQRIYQFVRSETMSREAIVQKLNLDASLNAIDLMSRVSKTAQMNAALALGLDVNAKWVQIHSAVFETAR